MNDMTLAQLEEKKAQLEADFERERAALEKQIAITRKAGQAQALSQIRAIMNEYGVGLDDLGGKNKATKKSKNRGSVAAKYRGPNGETWTGRGRQPKWLGDEREKFLIK